MKHKRIVGLLMLGLLLGSPKIAVALGSATTLSAGSASGNPGQVRTIPVSLAFDSGVEISGINFDLTFDSDMLSVDSVTLGPAASGMILGSSEPVSGTARVILFSVVDPPTLLSEGTVVNIAFTIKPDASPGTFPLSLVMTTMTDPIGSGVPHSTSGGSFTVNAPTSTPTPTLTNTPVPTSTSTNTPGPSATPSNTPIPSNTPTTGPSPTPSNTSPPTATHTPGPSPTASSTPSGTLTPSPTATMTPTRLATTTRTLTVKGAGEGLELEGAAAATGTALAEFEDAVGGTSTALAEEAAAQPTDEIVSTRPNSGTQLRPEIIVAAGLLLVAITLGGGAAYLIWRRGRAKA